MNDSGDLTRPRGPERLATRLRNVRDRRASTVSERAQAALWVALAAVVAWLFIAGFTGLTAGP